MWVDGRECFSLPHGGGPVQQFVSRHEIKNAITIDSRQHYGG
jgi:hypothetical protein